MVLVFSTGLPQSLSWVKSQSRPDFARLMAAPTAPPGVLSVTGA